MATNTPRAVLVTRETDYELLLGRFGIDPHRSVYVDDVVANAEAARPFGIHAIPFSTPDALREELIRLALL